MSNWKHFLTQGKKTEGEFIECLQKELGGTITSSSELDDIRKHVDLYWNGYGIDVKGLKKTSRKDQTPNEDIHWVELKNVRGNKGWLFGESDYIAFELEDYWILVTPKRIIDLLDQKITNFDVISDNSLLYRYYQRTGRKDIIVKVKTIDLLIIANKIITKIKYGE